MKTVFHTQDGLIHAVNGIRFHLDYLQQHPDRVLWPGMAISLTALSVNYVATACATRWTLACAAADRRDAC